MTKRIILLSIVSALLAVAAGAKDRPYTPPRLSDGKPDLQGVWIASNITPLARPNGIDALVITSEQARQITARAIARDEDRTKPTEPTEYFDNRGVERVRGEYRSSIIVDPPDGKLPTKPEYGSIFTNVLGGPTVLDGPEPRPASERCLPALTAIPPMLAWPSNSLLQFVQTADAMVIYAEALHDARVIRVNGKHTPAIHSWLGDSIGHWEADTFVVTTKYFHPYSHARLAPDYAFLISDQATVTERFTRVSADELFYEFTVDDPVYYTRPWRGESHFLRSADRIYEYACHEGNYSLPSILRAPQQAR